MPNPEQTLQTLARLNPDYPAFAASLPEELTHTQEPLPEDLIEDVYTLLRRDRPELTKFLDSPHITHEPNKFFLSPETVLPLIAILFLLRTHVKLEAPGILIEHKPMGDKLIKKILDSLNKYFLIK